MRILSVELAVKHDGNRSSFLPRLSAVVYQIKVSEVAGLGNTMFLRPFGEVDMK